ncbi:Gfo/Idh/MocA family oxidoreductase [Marivita sp. XM-24bin2]|jgi:predicted dehydrogenase|uniref:Gfo/Idh/MocA family protein n=1 Tax=unclassified Marivita TaxID=2632480 RepID=UPI000D7A0A85|nr:Gfo/Idh/MocA family oxidoreductase [Marivita sp. XM-24bin2]MCR9107302.1 Gfo/Idh/MocA family oxidoreductase [Paracoccaceae bacterium]PWL36572.1 MAG: oxidoreductase [Marivita sp. XM-24bin2]
MTTLRWGILGAAKFAREQMAPAIHAARQSKLSMLATSDPAKALPFQALESDLRVADSYDAVLSDPDVDAVYIPLPNSLHVDWTRRALEAGKHVLTEKPIAMKASEIDELVDLRDRTGLVAAEAYMIVHHPQWHQVRQWVQSGAIGDLCRVNATFTYDNSSDPGNIRNAVETGGGSLPDIGVYTLGCTRFVAGQEPQNVLFADIRRENGVEVRAEALVQFEGFTLTSLTSMRMQGYQSVTFQGTDGVIEVSVPFTPLRDGDAEIRLIRKSGPEEVLRYPGVNQYVAQVEAFGAAVRGEAPYPCPLEFSQGTQALIDMIWAAER